MAFKLRAPATEETRIPQLAEHPEFARHSGIRRALLAAIAERQRETDILAIEGELNRPASGSNKGERADRQRARLQDLRAAMPRIQTAPDPDGLPASVAMGLRLLAGEVVAPEPDRATRLSRLRSESEALDLALRETLNRLEEICDEQSLATAHDHAERHTTIVRRVFEAGAALSQAMDEERPHVSQILKAGYHERPDVTIRPGMSGAVRRGSRAQYDSEISNEQRRLTALGVL